MANKSIPNADYKRAVLDYLADISDSLRWIKSYQSELADCAKEMRFWRVGTTNKKPILRSLPPAQFGDLPMAERQ